MKISDRFTDYGMIGGTFWLLEFFFYVAFGGLPEILKHISLVNSLNVATVSVLGVVGLIVVFSTGLLLDLIAGPAFRLVEARILANHIRQHQTWFEPFLAKSASYVQQDYAVIYRVPTYLESVKAGFTIWRKRSREISSLRRQLENARSYVRLSSFLLAYVSLASGTDRTEILGKQMALWITSRAIGMGVGCSAFLYLAFIFLTPIGSTSMGSVGSGVAEIVDVILIVALLALTIAAFDRFCSTLFALIYVIDSKSPKFNDAKSAVAIDQVD
jgi:hypothetical protein